MVLQVITFILYCFPVTTYCETKIISAIQNKINIYVIFKPQRTGLRRPVPERVPVVEKHCFGRSNFTSIENAGAKTEQINDCRLHFFLDDFDFAER